MTLMDTSYLDVFFAFASDIVRRTSDSAREDDAMRRLYKALRQWKQLFSQTLARRLGHEELRGLVGELWFAFNHLTSRRPASEVVHAWRGPLGADQDFRFASGEVFEIKAIFPDATDVKISSAEQLDIDGMTLCLVLLEDAGAGGDYSFTLRDLIRDARAQIESDPDVASELDSRLRRFGLSDDGAAYDDSRFSVVALRGFSVTEGFPRLRRARLSPAVSSVRYCLDLQALGEYELDRLA